MPLFRRENDSRRVVSFPDRATAQDTVRLIAQSGALRGTSKPTKAESAATRSEIKNVQADAKTLADSQPKAFAKKDAPDIWSDNKPNFEAHREAQVWPSSGSPTGKPGGAEYGKKPPAPAKDIWSD
jgi:hypothetical protein